MGSIPPGAPSTESKSRIAYLEQRQKSKSRIAYLEQRPKSKSRIAYLEQRQKVGSGRKSTQESRKY